MRNWRSIQSMIILLSFLFCAFGAYAQNNPITGTVIDEKGLPVHGATATVENTTRSTQTNENGIFTLQAAPGEKIIVSYINYQPAEVVVTGETSYIIALNQSVTELSDVVVVGYGTQRKVNMVGAVSAVKIDEKVTTRALPNLSSALSGMVPGLAATQNSGMAGRNGATLLIRGLGSVNSSGPLIVVDGMPDVDINRLNINDIESVSVLKDATAASVYGSRGANGVVLVTTKSGKGAAEKTAITFTSNTALTTATKPFRFMSDYPRALFTQQIAELTSKTPDNLNFKDGTIDEWMAKGMIDPLRFPNTDWWDLILRNGWLQNYNVSANGGDDKSNFFVSLGYKDEKGLQINNDYKQYNARINFDYKLLKNLKTGVKLFGNSSEFSYTLEDGFTESTDNNTAGLDMRYAIAGVTPYDPVSGLYGGAMAYNESPQAFNPYAAYTLMIRKRKRQEGNGNIYLQWEPVKGLTGAVEYYLNYYNQFQSYAPTPAKAYNFQINQFNGREYIASNAGISNAIDNGFKTMFNTRLNYKHNFGGNHDVGALLVYSEEYWFDRDLDASRNDRLHPSLSEIDAALTTVQSNGGSSSAEGLRSYIGRLNYTGFNKYLFEANFRVDGSSKFLKGSQYGFFPSAALGWRFTQEKFLSFLDGILNDGKFRISYGALGNNSGVSRYQQQETLDANAYMIDNSIAKGLVYSQLINRQLSWEATSVFNTGLDLTFLRNRLKVELDYYDRFTTGMLRPSDISIFLDGAYSAPRKNIGDLRNKGVELDVKWNERVGELSYGVNLNASYNQNRLEKWNEYLGRGTTFLNMPYNFVYTYVDRGIAQTWQDIYNATPQGAKPGDLLFEDLNGDGRIDGNDRKATTNLRTRPTTNAAVNLFAAWKGIDLAVFFTGATGRKDYWVNIYNDLTISNQRAAITWDIYENPWRTDNRTGIWPRMGGLDDNNENTTFWLDDMSYVRLKNIQLGYSVPAFIVNKFFAKTLRFAFSAENLATFTKYRGLDPEKQNSANDVYPLNKSYNLSILLGF